MKQGSLPMIYSIWDLDPQETTMHFFSHAFYVLLGAGHVEEFRISIYCISPTVLLQCKVIFFS
jgi:hypothetical protein